MRSQEGAGLPFLLGGAAMAYRKPGQMGRHAGLPLPHPRPGGVDAVAVTGGAALRGLVGVTERAEGGQGTGEGRANYGKPGRPLIGPGNVPPTGPAGAGSMRAPRRGLAPPNDPWENIRGTGFPGLVRENGGGQWGGIPLRRFVTGSITGASRWKEPAGAKLARGHRRGDRSPGLGDEVITVFV
jgi:hypothetical protein